MTVIVMVKIHNQLKEVEFHKFPTKMIDHLLNSINKQNKELKVHSTNRDLNLSLNAVIRVHLRSLNIIVLISHIGGGNRGEEIRINPMGAEINSEMRISLEMKISRLICHRCRRGTILSILV